ncbi:MAG: tetratricopeptide repeat protein [Planctomycetota bacterium]|nr:MAG: tetratricopeptide repeat protein [Planctomycetota bacterium]
MVFYLVFCMGAVPTLGQREAERAAVGGKLAAARAALATGDYQRTMKLAREATQQAGDAASVWQEAGELMYRSGHPAESLPLFERAVELRPESLPYNWQRGIALATCAQWEAAAEQFARHREVNPDDVENSAWHYLCVAKRQGADVAQTQLIPSRGDPRPPMMEVLRMLRGELQPAQLIAQVENNDALAAEAKERALFYAQLYAGLYCDARGDIPQALQYLEAAQQTSVRGYMPDAARVYLQALRSRAVDPHNRNDR